MFVFQEYLALWYSSYNTLCYLRNCWSRLRDVSPPAPVLSSFPCLNFLESVRQGGHWASWWPRLQSKLWSSSCSLVILIADILYDKKAGFQLRREFMSSFVDRAKQLHSAGFTSMEKIGKARPVELSAAVEHLSLKAAIVIIQVSRALHILWSDASITYCSIRSCFGKSSYIQLNPDLTQSVPLHSWCNLIQGAKLILTEKVEQHRDEAESIVLEMAS